MNSMLKALTRSSWQQALEKYREANPVRRVQHWPAADEDPVSVIANTASLPALVAAMAARGVVEPYDIVSHCLKTPDAGALVHGAEPDSKFEIDEPTLKHPDEPLPADTEHGTFAIEQSVAS